MHGGDIYNNDIDIDFSVNLNPYVDPKIKEQIASAAREGFLRARSYPDITQTGVRLAIACSEDVENECIIAGSGASELITGIVHALLPKTALLPRPCFSGYERALHAAGCAVRSYMMKEENGFSLTSDNPADMVDAADIMFIADPQNPSGKNIDEDLIIRILESAKNSGTTVVIDESFMPLSQKYMLFAKDRGRYRQMLEKFDNVYFVRSYTKSFALPGIRMGYCISRKENIQKLAAHLPEWNLSTVAADIMRLCAKISQDPAFFAETYELIKREKDMLSGELTGLGYKVFDSDTLYLLIKGQKGLYEKLLERGILIRKCDDFCGLDERFYRIAVKTHPENERLIGAMR